MDNKKYLFDKMFKKIHSYNLYFLTMGFMFVVSLFSDNTKLTLLLIGLITAPLVKLFMSIWKELNIREYENYLEWEQSRGNNNEGN